jgi:hypothetical protein
MRLEGWGGPPNSGLPEFGILMWERMARAACLAEAKAGANASASRLQADRSLIRAQ